VKVKKISQFCFAMGGQGSGKHLLGNENHS